MFRHVMSIGISSKASETKMSAWRENLKLEINKDVTTLIESYEERIKSLEKNLRESDRKAALTHNILQRNRDITNDLSKRLDTIELANARRMAILTGLKLDEKKKKDQNKRVLDFISTELEVFTRIEDTYTLGNSDIPPIIITFQTLHDKEAVFEKKAKLKDGPEVRSNGSIYVPYAIDTSDYQNIRKAYMKIRLLHAPARHIVCAYSLPGDPLQGHHLHDSCDDGEFGAGPILLKAMRDSNIVCKAFFIVRYCGNQKLGTDRFRHYIEAAKGLIKQKPVNKILEKSQQFIEQPQPSRKYKYSEKFDDQVQKPKPNQNYAKNDQLFRGRGRGNKK